MHSFTDADFDLKLPNLNPPGSDFILMIKVKGLGYEKDL